MLSDLYISGSNLRLRKMEHADGRIEYKLGQKRSIDAYHREMTTLYLTEQEYETLRVLPGQWLMKERYPHRSVNGASYEINVFKGGLVGLVIAEIEFDTEEGLLAAPAPPTGWVEISEDATYDGVSLAERG